MERDNQKEDKITLEEACQHVRAFMQKAAISTGAGIWIGQLIEETGSGYIIPVALYHDGERPEENHIRAWVDKLSGKVSLALDLIA